jgi:HK97 gp10 family phage protein
MSDRSKVKITSNFEKGKIRLSGFSKKAVKEVEDEMHDTANMIRNEILLSFQQTPQTGKHYKRGPKIHIASSPGRPPAIDSGDLKRSIKMNVRKMSGFEVEVGSNIKKPKYPIFLEEGTKDMASRPFLEPAVKKKTKFMEQRIMRAINRIRV